MNRHNPGYSCKASAQLSSFSRAPCTSFLASFSKTRVLQNPTNERRWRSATGFLQRIYPSALTRPTIGLSGTRGLQTHLDLRWHKLQGNTRIGLTSDRHNTIKCIPMGCRNGRVSVERTKHKWWAKKLGIQSGRATHDAHPFMISPPMPLRMLDLLSRGLWQHHTRQRSTPKGYLRKLFAAVLEQVRGDMNGTDQP